MKLRTWLRPGMFVKRWILLLFSGLVMTSLALAMALAWVYRNYHFPDRFTHFVQTVTLQFIPHPYRELVMLTGGAIGIGLGFYQLSRSLLAPFWDQRPAGKGLADLIQAHRFGPEQPELRVVAIGGGTGLSTLLRGLKQKNVAITAIVTVGDDGGSSGRLRTEFNMPPPGDIRNCLVALADAEPLMADLFQYRFEENGSALGGHSFGNLFITAMTQVAGSFERAVYESSRVLAVRGQVIPSSLENITVCAELEDGRIIRGESRIVAERSRIKRVFLDPKHPAAYDPAIVAILSADLIVLGPGSLYTSVLPNLLVQGITHAIRCSTATKVYVCNVATQRGETDDFRVVDHLRALHDHVGEPIVDHVLVNDNFGPAATKIKPEWAVSAVSLDGIEALEGSVNVVLRDVVNPEFPLRHDPDKLATALIELAKQRPTPPGVDAVLRANGHDPVSGSLESQVTVRGA
ncbi:gluconeogenesis factor YvcK family protein [Sphaerobacter thermophilus]|uniref:Putative gluconeogenesis factor n=1 Tax=Sphaerobacter thermophilus (strain ATCC 49802 / DSM 20745 / KCCM 41009 / NCIMB 13125 / S 6022) TaxID=479434 RepID=D1C372_SPHTD|nr:gluconeogenesis factor YvcK family protein [Sphaerobacter thermophilus]ACZ38689.1 protein of unknown function UPF0052 and CofD [Sphaerobacter thermophilus DSM 20745]